MVTYKDIFSSIEIGHTRIRYPSELMKLGASVLDLAKEPRGRKDQGINYRARPASGFPTALWSRNINGRDVSLGVVDKRKAGIGLLLTARAEVEVEDCGALAVVKAIAVNDKMPASGLNRFVDQGLPTDTAEEFIELLHQSREQVPLHRSAGYAQRIDYARAITTIYH